MSPQAAHLKYTVLHFGVLILAVTVSGCVGNIAETRDSAVAGQLPGAGSGSVTEGQPLEPVEEVSQGSALPASPSETPSETPSILPACQRVLGLCASGSTTGFGDGRTYVVSPGDAITTVTRTLAPGDTLYLKGGVYRGLYLFDDAFTQSGTETQRITISGYPGETAIIERGGTFSSLKSTQYLTFRNLEIRDHAGVVFKVDADAHHNRFENLYIHDIGLGGAYASAFEIFRVRGTAVRNNRIDRVGSNVYHHALYLAYGSQYTQVYSNWISNVSGACIHAWSQTPRDIGAARDSVFYNNLFGCNYWGIILGDASHDIQILSNTIYSKGTFGRAGISLYNRGNAQPSYSPYRITIKNNIIYGEQKVEVDPDTKAELQTSGIADAGVVEDIVGSNNFLGDPLFFDLEAGDFRLKPGSPVIGAGEALSAVQTDIAGAERDTGAPDIGAYESL